VFVGETIKEKHRGSILVICDIDIDEAPNARCREVNLPFSLEAILEKEGILNYRAVANERAALFIQERTINTAQVGAYLGAGQAHSPFRLEPIAQEHGALYLSTVAGERCAILVLKRRAIAVEVTADLRAGQAHLSVGLEPSIEEHLPHDFGP
jgi:hypothetical protein